MVSRIEILLAEDNPGDILLTREALTENKIYNTLNVVEDGEKALRYLRKEGEYSSVNTPDLIILDLNLPRIDGREVLKEIKSDPLIKQIPVVIMSTSEDKKDVLLSYKNHANCYITKPFDMEQFAQIVKQVQNFWFSIVKLPSN